MSGGRWDKTWRLALFTARLVAIPVTLITAACAHDVRISSEPPGAVISTAGRTIGRTPLTVSQDALNDAAKDGLVRLVIAKPGYHSLDVVLPPAPLHDRVAVGLAPFRDRSVPASPAPSLDTDEAPSDEPRLPVSATSFEADLALLLRYQGNLLLGAPVTPLRLDAWQRIYPTSGGPAFLEGLRAYQEGRRDDAGKLLGDAVKRDDRDIDYRIIAGEASKPSSPPSGG